MSILSGIVGLINGNRAANAVQVANHDAMNGVLSGNEKSNANVTAAGQAGVNAVNTATGVANNTIAASYNRQMQGLEPYGSAGQQGVAGLRDMAANPMTVDKFAWDPTTNMNDPAFKFRQQQGMEAIQNQNALKGLLSSGNFAKDIGAFTVGNAAQYENDDFNRSLNTFKTNTDNMFKQYDNQYRNNTTLANIGLDTQGKVNQVEQNASGQIANNTLGAGYYDAETGNSIAKFLAQLNANAANDAGRFRVGQGEGTAARNLNTGNQISDMASGIPDLFKTVSGLFKP